MAARLARALNRVFRRSGQALHGRYHLRVLRTFECSVQRRVVAHGVQDARYDLHKVKPFAG